MERETRIELATNSLEGCDSTTELLPLKTVGSEQWSALMPPGLSNIARQLLTVHCALEILELMTGFEPVTSPLPRECSTN